MMTQAGTDLAAAFHDILKARYDQKVPGDPVQKARVKAWERYLEMGLPTRKSEAYGYIKLRHLFREARFTPRVSVSQKQVAEWIYPECRQSVLVFVNGHYAPELSNTQALPQKAVVATLEDATKTYSAFLTNHWTKVLKEELDPFAALNAALFEGGVFIYLPPNCVVSCPLQVLHLIVADEDAVLAMPRVHVVAGSHAQLSLISSTAAAPGAQYGINQVLDFSLEEGAHVQVMQSAIAGDGWHLEALRATLKKNSSLKTVQMSEGSLTTRYDYHVGLAGQNAEASLNGVSLLDGKREAHLHVLIDHQAPHCRSNQLFKNILNGTSRSSFEGKILVQQIAQKTEAFQLNNNLLLSDHAHADSKPNLEIFADDVKASHGATIGQLNPEEVFYMLTKGIPPALAKNLLISGFCKEVIELFSLPSLYQFLSKRAELYLTQD